MGKAEIAEIRSEAEEKCVKVREEGNRQLLDLLRDCQLNTLRDKEENTPIVRAGTQISERLFQRIDFFTLVAEEGWTDKKTVNDNVDDLFRYVHEQIQLIEEQSERSIERLTRGDELPPGIIQLVKVYIAKKRKLSVGDKMAGRQGE